MSVTTKAARASQQDLDRLATRYSFRSEEEVKGFLRDHPGVVATLLEAANVIPHYFGEDTPVALEVVRDRDAPSHVDIFARIQTGLDVDSALERLDRFDHDWWLDALPGAEYALTVTLEFV